MARLGRLQDEIDALIRNRLVATVRETGALRAAAKALDLTESQAARLWHQLGCGRDCPLARHVGVRQAGTHRGPITPGNGDN